MCYYTLKGQLVSWTEMEGDSLLIRNRANADILAKSVGTLDSKSAPLALSRGHTLAAAGWNEQLARPDAGRRIRFSFGSACAHD